MNHRSFASLLKVTGVCLRLKANREVVFYLSKNIRKQRAGPIPVFVFVISHTADVESPLCEDSEAHRWCFNLKSRELRSSCYQSRSVTSRSVT